MLVLLLPTAHLPSPAVFFQPQPAALGQQLRHVLQRQRGGQHSGNVQPGPVAQRLVDSSLCLRHN